MRPLRNSHTNSRTILICLASIDLCSPAKALFCHLICFKTNQATIRSVGLLVYILLCHHRNHHITAKNSHTTVRPRYYAPLYYADLCYTRIFFRKLVPPTISYVLAIVHAVLVLKICRNIERTSRYNDGIMKSLAIESLSISCNLDVYHFILQSTELQSKANTLWSELWHTTWTRPASFNENSLKLQGWTLEN
jgi:hypothetical protein